MAFRGGGHPLWLRLGRHFRWLAKSLDTPCNRRGLWGIYGANNFMIKMLDTGNGVCRLNGMETQNTPAKVIAEYVEILGIRVRVGTKKHAKLVREDKHLADLLMSEQN